MRYLTDTRVVNVICPEMSESNFWALEENEKNRLKKRALLNFIQEEGYPEVSKLVKHKLAELGQDTEDVLYIPLYTGSRPSHIEAYTYDMYGRLALQLFEVHFVPEKKAI